jgi:uncharacterized protein (TIGR02246 family)
MAMADTSEQTARGLLTQLEESLATHDLKRILELWTDDAVLIGDSEENFDGAATAAYLGGMAEMAPTVRWQWDHVAVVLDAPALLGVAAAGTIAFHDPEGKSLGDPEPFRATCLAVEVDGGWRLKHFHGSARRPE